MRKILFSALLILGAGSALATGASGAFFSDTESSSGNTFAAGAIDLKIDNDSWYNGNHCVFLNAQATSTPGFYWQGPALYPAAGSPCDTSWALDDLSNGHLFFNFKDLKPDDESEDTISMHVQNDAWACLRVSLTSNDDRSSTEPELADGDTPEDPDNTWDGELAQNLQMVWWADDGDNVYEVGEPLLTPNGGVVDLYNLATSTPFTVTLADASGNAWGGTGPLPANQTKYIAKGWCFGTLTLDPVPAGQGVNPGVNPGFHCDGTRLNNLTQTDAATVDVEFETVQARHNPDFRCTGLTNSLGKLTVIKLVRNDNGGNNIVSDFHLFIDNGTVTTQVTSGATTTVSSGTYSVSETGVSGYVGTFPTMPGQSCDLEGNVTIGLAEEKICYIMNDDLQANITLIKNVTGTQPLADPSTFKMRVDGILVPNTTSVPVNSNSSHFVTEDAKAGYHFVSIGGPQCPISSTSSPIILNEGQAVTCIITNAKN
jgi:predicted ribosomally synthesized peptide with SipW-like signal peptide